MSIFCAAATLTIVDRSIANISRYIGVICDRSSRNDAPAGCVEGDTSGRSRALACCLAAHPPTSTKATKGSRTAVTNFISVIFPVLPVDSKSRRVLLLGRRRRRGYGGPRLWRPLGVYDNLRI